MISFLLRYLPLADHLVLILGYATGKLEGGVGVSCFALEAMLFSAVYFFLLLEFQDKVDFTYVIGMAWISIISVFGIGLSYFLRNSHYSTLLSFSMLLGRNIFSYWRGRNFLKKMEMPASGKRMEGYAYSLLIRGGAMLFVGNRIGDNKEFVIASLVIQFVAEAILIRKGILTFEREPAFEVDGIKKKRKGR